MGTNGLSFKENGISKIINVKRIIDNRKFWQSVKQNFTDKTFKDERMILIHGVKAIAEEKDVKKYRSF